MSTSGVNNNRRRLLKAAISGGIVGSFSAKTLAADLMTPASESQAVPLEPQIPTTETAQLPAPDLLAPAPPSVLEESEKDTLEVDISRMEPGQLLVLNWPNEDKPTWILRRTEANLKDLQSQDDGLLEDPYSLSWQQPDYAKNPLRSIRPEFAVYFGLCTHKGCKPDYRPEIAPKDIGPEWRGGFHCHCHGSRYDLAGRVFKGVPAPLNLEVPSHTYLSDTIILLGEDPIAS